MDDAEYQIPQIIEPPTLESILNEGDDHISLNEDCDSLNWSQGIHSSLIGIEGGSETLSIASRRSRTSSDKKDSSSSTAFLRFVLLKSVSTQISSAVSEKVFFFFRSVIGVYKINFCFIEINYRKE